MAELLNPSASSASKRLFARDSLAPCWQSRRLHARVVGFCSSFPRLPKISTERALIGPTSRADPAQKQLRRLALLWQILSYAGFPNQFFCDSWAVGFWRADHEEHIIGLGSRACTVAEAVRGPVRAQGEAANVPALRGRADRAWRSQECSADGRAACTWRL